MAATILLALTTGVAYEPVFPGSVPVFYSGLNGSKCFRIPTIIKTSTGALLAFSENRITDCGDNGALHNLVMRRSTDNGATWGPMATVVKGTVPCPKCPAAVSNPNPLEVTMPDESKRILLHYDTMNNPRPTAHGLDMQQWSDDDGVTWGSSTTLSYPPENNTGALIGPSVGIQSAEGILYFSNFFNMQHWLYWSKDYGKTWQSSEPIPGINECSIAFQYSPTDGRIIMNCRTGEHHRAQVLWSADGKPGNVTYPDGLIDPNCQGSIVNNEGTLYTSNANTTTTRSHMTVKKSTDHGESWSAGHLVYAGPSGYSQLVPLKGEKLGLLFEAGTKETYETISYTTVEY